MEAKNNENDEPTQEDEHPGSESTQKILSTSTYRRLYELTDTGGTRVLDILVRSFNHLSNPESATCKREAQAQTDTLVSDIVKTFSGAIVLIQEKSAKRKYSGNDGDSINTSTGISGEDYVAIDEDPAFAICLGLLRLYKVSLFCDRSKDSFPDNLFEQISDFCRQQLDNFMVMQPVHSIAVAYGLQFLHQMNMWNHYAYYR